MCLLTHPVNVACGLYRISIEYMDLDSAIEKLNLSVTSFDSEAVNLDGLIRARQLSS